MSGLVGNSQRHICRVVAQMLSCDVDLVNYDNQSKFSDRQCKQCRPRSDCSILSAAFGQITQRRTCIKNTHILLKNQHAATAGLFLRKVSGIVLVYESGINLTC